ncbi:MAG: peptidase domain-containing ABC transporter [Bacteroidaceae bacterium]|nr:peptidase domain-containing ABC transporter [Bacteroidaceae bacterium]
MIRRFPHFHQLDSMDCGPACLRMVARFYGKCYRLETLRERCFITREGVSMLGIADAAETIGFRTTGVRTSVGELAGQRPLPCIVHWNQNHFVVLYDIKRNRRTGARTFYVADPASQLVHYGEEEFMRCWGSSLSARGERLGVALLLTPTPDFERIDDEPEASVKRDLLFFARYLLPHRRAFFQLVLGMLVGMALQLMAPFLTQAMVDQGIGGHNLGFITLILLAQLGLFVAQLTVGFIRSWLTLHMNARIDIALISDFLMKLMRLPLRYFDTKKTGDIMQRIGDHSRIKGFLMGNSVSILFSLASFVVFGAILAYYHWQILCIFLVGNALYVAWVLSFMKYRRELDIRRFNQSAAEQSNVIQLIQGMQEIKLNNCERQKRWEWERIQVRLFRISVRGLTVGQVQELGSVFFTQTTHILISFIAAKAVVDGAMTLGMMMSLTYIIGQVSAPIGQFLGLAQSLQDAKISLERLNEVHGQTDEEMNAEGRLHELPRRRDISVEDVSFSYSGADRDYALEHLSLRIPEGKVTAIVGASGSGKTTLVKLLLGFYEPLRGHIRVGGTPLNLIDPHVWRAATGSVMQEGFIFSDTIARNIAVADERIDAERLQRAVEVANVEDFVESLPLGFSTKVGMEGNGVSQGQRQRLLIARAVYKDPLYLFFDEATNSLDANNERSIMEHLKEFYRGRTVVIVAHRLSTVRGADNIIVLDHGHMVEQGTHEQLTALRGAYYTLVKNQLELGN